MSIRVMLVDDHAVVREGLKAWLEGEPDIRVVSEAESGSQALEVFNPALVDVVVVDVRLPDMSGLELIRQLRRRAPNKGYVILSSYANEPLLNQALQLRVNAYVLKEAGSDELIHALRAAAQGEHLLTRASIPAILAQHRPSQYSEEFPFASLTAREMEILALIAQGLTNREISRQLFLSEGTVRNYISHIMAKLRLRNRVELAAYALKHNIFDWVPPLSEGPAQEHRS